MSMIVTNLMVTDADRPIICKTAKFIVRMVNNYWRSLGFEYVEPSLIARLEIGTLI